MKLKINLYGSTFKHNKVDKQITSTQGKLPKYIEYVENKTGSINLFVDRAIYDVGDIENGLKNYAWLLESHGLTMDLVDYFKENTLKKVEKFELIFTHNKELLELNDKFKFLHPVGSWIDENKNENEIKTKLISMISSDKQHTPTGKERYLFALKNINNIDVFGNGFHSINKKEVGLNSYYFSVVFENDLTPDYFSEKLLDCFMTKTIPIYLGSENIGDYFDIKGIIKFEDFDSKNISSKLYRNMQKYVEKNYELVQNYLLPENNMYKYYLS